MEFKDSDEDASYHAAIMDFSEEAKESDEIMKLADRLREGIEVKDRRYHFQKYEKCFLGSEAVSWLIDNGEAQDVEQAIHLGNAMMTLDLIKHVTKDHDFKNEKLFYRFYADENRGAQGETKGGQTINWTFLLDAVLPTQMDDASLQSNLGDFSLDDLMAKAENCEVAPLDEHNIKLLNNVQPAAWNDPAPEQVYNLVVIGAGTGGLVAAAGSAGLFAKVAMIENNLMGGDCLNVGCVPSKALIKCAEVAHAAKTAEEFGVEIIGEVKVNFGKVMERMRKLRAGISHHDSAERFSRELGVDIFLGWGKFTSPNTVEVNGKSLRFKKAVIASGSQAAVPPIEGMQDVPYLTNTSIFNLTVLPRRMIAIGFGPIGLELAQCMCRFGSQVTVLGRSGKILPKEDEDAAEIVYQSMLRDGMDFMFNVKFVRVTHDPPAEGQEYGTIKLHIEHDGQAKVIEAEALLLGTGRKPNVEGMDLEVANVHYNTRQGIVVNDHLQTSNKNIYAVGDCCTKYQFTHVADFMARIVIRNALFFGRAKFSSLLIPWSTFTSPEVAHVGYYPHDLEEQGIQFTTYTKNFGDVDRAILEGETEGFVKIHCKKGSDTILGATIVGPSAGDMISEISVAMQNKVGLSSIATVIHPYPTKAEAIRQAGDLYNRTKLTPRVKGLFVNLMNIQRR